MQDINIVIENLKANGFDVTFATDRAEALEAVKAMLPAGASVGVGGSMTLKECGILELLKSDDYNFATGYEKNVDFYLCSTNAITAKGELYNVDGRANRISAIAYGPKNVILVAGINKLCDDLAAAVYRVKTVCAPRNTLRLGSDTPCKTSGRCVSLADPKCGMTDGCTAKDRICCHYLVSGRQRIPGRIKLVLVNESLGY